MAGVAARVATFEKLYGGFVTPSSGTGDDDRLHPIVELFLNEQWVDISSYVYYRDMITITRGRNDEASQTDPSTCRFTLNNRDGRFSPRNPTGPYYGTIGRNTPVRVSIVRNGIRRYRFYGEISSWPTKWDISGSDVWTEVEGAGILRRLGQGSSPLRSALYRNATQEGRTAIVAYWPLEDGTGSTTLASGHSGGSAMTFTGTPTFEAYDDYAGSSPVITGGSIVANGTVLSHTVTGEYSLRSFLFLPTAGVSSQQTLFTLSTTGSARTFKILLETDGDFTIQAYDSDSASLLNSRINFNANSQKCSLVVELTQNGSDIDWLVIVENYTNSRTILDSSPSSQLGGTITSQTLGQAKKVSIGHEGGLGDVAIGHVMLANDLNAYTAIGPGVLANRGEAVSSFDASLSNRIARLCRENGIAFFDVGKTTTDTARCGEQDTDTFVTLIQKAADADRGILYEPRDAIGLSLRSLPSLYNQNAALTLDYGNNELSEPLDPVDDDRYVRNDITVTREHGSSYRVSLDEGNLSTQDPPDGVGRYDTSGTVSVSQDTALPNQANWRLHEGTVDEARFPSVSINLRHSTFTGSVSMMNAALSVDIGDRIVVANPPAWMPPDDVSCLVQGYTEVLGFREHDISFITTPESVYHVVEANSDTYGRLDSDTSTLTSSVSSSDTSISVTSTGQRWVDSAAYASEFPFDIIVGGERVTVTAISGTSSPQTFTVARSVNGIIKSHSSGAEVHVFTPVYIPL